MQSLWSSTTKMPEFPKLESDIQTDVLIIGGGIAGILCAYYLQQSGVNYVLVESRTICSGVTKNTTAKITAQHGLVYDTFIKDMGREKAKLYLDANVRALNEYRKLCKNIDCKFEIKDSYVYSLDNISKIESEVSALNKLGVKATFESKVELPFQVAGAVKFPEQAQFQPLDFISAIAANLNIYEHTHVKEMIGTRAITEGGSIRAQKVIAATHFPFINKHGSYFLKQYQHRSYVIAYENAVNLDGMYVDEAQNGMSFRNASDLLLIGGGDHRTGKKGGNWAELEAYAKRYYPEAKRKYYWATQDCMSLDSIPYIGQYSRNTPNLYVCTGFNKWGMTSAMVSAMILTDLIKGKKNEYAKVFSPSRSMLKLQLAVNAFEATLNLLTPTTKRCPHLGCALKWNKLEHTWDCPCHGSRFSDRGVVLDNPANANLK